MYVYFCVVLVPYIMRLSIIKVNDQQVLKRVYVLHLEWFGGRGGVHENEPNGGGSLSIHRFSAPQLTSTRTHKVCHLQKGAMVG